MVQLRSAVGAVDTNVSGIQLGGVMQNVARIADHMAFVRSFAHGNSGHGGGTHWVMTGYDYPPADQGRPPIRPRWSGTFSETTTHASKST